ncbi:MAG: hypothetical protein ACD_46C00533G0006 [uncultured bacterium]|nr:MAG: hypothetical protein ACD_46C00533G0006 [uncultured bacterium]
MLTTIKSNILAFTNRTPYRRDIFLVLILKLLALLVIWKLFFSHPIDHSLTTTQLAQHYLTDAKPDDKNTNH